MNKDSYIYKDARKIRTTLKSVQYMNITLPPTSKAWGVIALASCQELVGDEWQKGCGLYGLVTKMDSAEQISHIVNGGGNLDHLNEGTTQFLKRT